MAKKKQSKVYRSVEQLKSELFPRLYESDRDKVHPKSSKELATTLANQAINRLLKEPGAEIA
jgi:hypothetical protein